MADWIRCSDRLPETQKLFYGKTMFYLTVNKFGIINIDIYADGWNTFIEPDGTINRNHEIKNIVAWMELPSTETVQDLIEDLIDE